MPSNDTTTMPASQACFTAPLSAVGEAALITMASKPCRIMFWICAACSVAWFSEVVKLGACATTPLATASLVTLSQLLSMAWRHELPAKLFDSAIFLALVSAALAGRCSAPAPSTSAAASAVDESRIFFMSDVLGFF
jgi:hypothetical protein